MGGGRGAEMTALTGNAKVTRETLASYRGRPLCVTVNAHEVVIREKGRRFSASVPIVAVYDLGFKILARQRAAEKAQKRGRK